METAIKYRGYVTNALPEEDSQTTSPESTSTTPTPAASEGGETAVTPGTSDVLTTPRKVTGVKVSASGKKKLTVKWKRQTGVSYKVAYSTDKKKLAKLKNGKTKAVSGVKIADVSKNSLLLKKLKGGKKYYIKVCAYTKKADSINVGNWSGVKSKKVKNS
jgi:hypothetical protein